MPADSVHPPAGPPAGHPSAPALLRPAEAATRAAHEEKSKLQKHFGRLDIFFFLICTLVGVDTIGSVAKSGAQGFTWLVVLSVTFFVPYALLTAELGSAFPDEGGAYIWTRLAFGRPVAAISALLYWVSNPIWLGGTLTITAVTAINTFFASSLPPHRAPLQGAAQYLFSLVFIWGTVAAAVLSFRIGKWIAIIGAWARLIVLPFFTITVLIYGQRHGLHGVAARAFAPTYVAFIGVAPVLFFNFVGFELPSAAGDEMTDPHRDVPFAVARSAVGTILLYGIPVLAILLVLPASQTSGLSGFLDAIKVVFTVYGGTVSAAGAASLVGAGRILGQVMCIAFVLALTSSGATWIMGADRAQAVAAYDGAAPRILGRFSRSFGTPVPMNILSGIISTAVMVAATVLSEGNARAYFQAGLGLAISTTTISYLAVFPALTILRRRYPDLIRPYSVPGGFRGVWICSFLSTFWALLSTIALIWPGFGIGWFGSSGNADASLPEGFAHHRMSYELTQVIPLLLLFALGLLFYRLGRPTRSHPAAA